MKSCQALDNFLVLNCDPDMKQAAAVTLRLTQELQGVARVSNLGHTEAAANASLSFVTTGLIPLMCTDN